MTNRELYAKDPRTHTLLNQGVAKVTSGQTDPELETLRYELENFVCDGQYADGLGRILSTFVGHLGKSEQPGVWVSGFYGSGKSHLVKMVQHLWLDFEFPDGARARGLTKLPANIKDSLKELSTQAKRHGGLHAAAGTLGSGAGDSVRLELLGIIFKSVGLPSDYRTASFVLWLREEGLEDAIMTAIAKSGIDQEAALANFYVSDAIAKAILKERPDFANKPGDVKLLLEKQFPERTDVSIEDMIAKIKQAIGKKGKLPCTLIVLDEVQQYIGESADRSKAVQDVEEQCCSRLGANVMFIATGQNALTSTGLLQRLQGRFPVPIELQDTDVEQVTREVVLKKKPTVIDGLKTLLEDHSGEIERQLASTKIAFTSRDRQLLVQDYPILPVRRRFWERVLRAVDKAGTGAQLRTQLWIVYDAVKQTADLPVGNVVPASFLFEHIKTKVLQSGVLLQEISENIARQKQEQDGDLRYQLCALIFLIGQLPHNNEPLDAGIRANAETLADLLVTDLTKSSAELRKKVPELLEKLVASGAVMQVEDEYRMQTRAGSEWNQAYQEARNKLLADLGKLASERSQLLKTMCSEILKKSKLLHGVSKEARKFELHFGENAPDTSGSMVPVWIRDGWEVQEKTIVSDARTAGDSTAVVYGFVPQKQAEELKQAIASYYAATTTIQTKGTPSTDEGEDAKRAMETRRDQGQRTRDNIINDILNDTAIYIAGGDLVNGMMLDTKVQDAAKACLDRLFPQFHLADSPDWHKVIERSKKTDPDALAAVGYKGDPENHAVCKAAIDFVGSGKKGTEVRKQFAGPPWGWPQDAIDAALIVLSNSGALQARSSTEPIAKGKLDQKNIAAAEFRVETITLSKVQLIAIRGLFKAIGLNTVPGQESLHSPEFLSRMNRLAEGAGGDPPLPKWPDTSHLTDIANRVGNDQLKVVYENKDRLTQEITDWQKRRDLIGKREPHWKQLTALLAHATDLPVAAEVQVEVKAIEDHRRLLDEPDPVPGLVNKLTEALRKALNEANAACAAAHDKGVEGLEANVTWQKLKPEQRYEILSKNGVRQMPTIAVGTTDEVLATLQKTKVSELQTIRDALPTRFSNAVAAAVKLLEPRAQPISLPGGTIKNEDDLQTWLSLAEDSIREKLKDGPVII
ncbi:MAG TPA: BREX system P-loop protein BrxC [Pirellulales bacterium]|jgi:hypothetical protein|nr:BREX system P-loop protein BrxC [Pirellulales bacterium]